MIDLDLRSKEEIEFQEGIIKIVKTKNGVGGYIHLPERWVGKRIIIREFKEK